MSVDVDQSGGMDVDLMGPVDYLVVEFPGNRMTGEGLPFWWIWWIGGSSGFWTSRL